MSTHSRHDRGARRRVAHFLTGDDDPPAVIRVLMDAAPPGSYLALTHVTAEHVPLHDSAAAQ